jgi:beta-1,4-mannosyl-glycoprotein beta-1,4-N-acetylglucosaminyltransferase
MIVDCFTFFNELEILEIRLHELDPWVNRFVLVESPETYSGNDKPLLFEENKHLFEPFLSKITHLVSPLCNNPKSAWDRQINQRDYAMQALSDCADEDLILIGDVDEVPKGRDFTKVRRKKVMTMFMHRNYFYYMNLRRPGGWPGTVMLPYRTLKSEFDGSLFKARMKRRSGHLTKGAWHFGHMGGMDAVILKLKSSCHFDSRPNRRLLANPKAIHDRMETTRGVNGRKLVTVPTNDHPVWFQENIEKFKHLLTTQVCEWCGEPLDKYNECKNWDECGWCDIMHCTYDDHDCKEGDE